MKCIRCGQDSRYKDRKSKRCRTCDKPFAFEPREGDPLTDAAFQSAIEAVSAKGRVRWGVEHLYYEVCRRRRPRAGNLRGWLSILAIFPGTFIGFVVMAYAPAFVPAGVRLLGALVFGVLAAWLVNRALSGLQPRTLTVGLTLAEFDRMWKRWQTVHGTAKGVIVRKTDAPAPGQVESDLADYSFDRALICDRARTVDLLIANNFHFENNCAVLAVGGYPPRPFETIRAMLRRNPRLQVFTLHDVTVPGCRLAHQLATSPEWFSGSGTVTDVGLRPRHAAPFRGLLLPLGAPVQPGDGISAEESEWLSQHTLELAAIRPEQVLKRLFRAINRDREPERERDESDDRDDPVDYDTESFSADAGDSDGGGDAFG